MSRTSLFNAAALTAAVLCAGGLAWPTERGGPARLALAPAEEARARPVPLPGGGMALPDASGHLVPLRPYRRIVSTSLLTDRLLVELGEPDRVLAFSAAGARGSPWSYQYAGKPAVEGLGALEPLIDLRPDLVLINSLGGPGRVDKLRAAGIEVFDFGEMRGLATLGPTAEAMAVLLGHPERGVRFARAFARRMAAVAAAVPVTRRHTAIYLAVIGPALYGGTVGTSYHDVLVAGGLIDAAAARYRDWPAYAPEQLLALAPQRIVTKLGMGGPLCHYPGLDRLPACRTPGAVVELPAGLLDEPGPAMLEAAERVFAAVYGPDPR
jgi:iron complex transport system substrate-binding protein